MVRISGFHPDGPGSIPGTGTFYFRTSISNWNENKFEYGQRAASAYLYLSAGIAQLGERQTEDMLKYIVIWRPPVQSRVPARTEHSSAADSFVQFIELPHNRPQRTSCVCPPSSTFCWLKGRREHSVFTVLTLNMGLSLRVVTPVFLHGACKW